MIDAAQPRRTVPQLSWFEIARRYVRAGGAVEFLGDAIREHGDLFLMGSGTKSWLVVSDVDEAASVLKNTKAFGRSKNIAPIKLAVGEYGLLTTEGEPWAQQRRLLAPVFRRHSVEPLVASFVGQTEGLLRRWEGKRSIDAAEEMSKLALDIVGSALIGSKSGLDATSLGRNVRFAIGHVGKMVMNPMYPPVEVPIPSHLRFRRAMRHVKAALGSLIEDRRRNPPSQVDLTAMLASARDEDTGEALSPERLLDQLLTFFVAGHETTASTLTWIWYCLSRHADVAAKVHEEVDRVLGDAAATPELIAQLTYTRMVVQETLRLYPPIWLMGRRALGKAVVAGVEVKRDQELLFPVYFMHRDPKHWQRPNEFFPEHFAPEAVAARNPASYLPFGIGPHTCIGNHLAMLEIMTVIPMVARRYELRVATRGEIRPEGSVSLRMPNATLPVQLRRRTPRAHESQ